MYNQKQRRDRQEYWYQIELEESLPSVLLDAIDYLELFYSEKKLPDKFLRSRFIELRREFKEIGTYSQTLEELVYGAKVAWRNSTSCIGRIFWQAFIVRDMRHLSTAEEVFEAIIKHILLATNGGKLKYFITIFAPNEPGLPGVRIWNPLLICYAGYLNSDGSVLGDPAQVKLTQICQQLGWSAPTTKTPFDVLPLIIQIPLQNPQLFEIPKNVVLEVPISHPDHPWFAELGLKWHVLPAVSNQRLEIGGISYSAAPFNGWYQSTEIACRNLGDIKRYNLLPTIAECLGLNTRSKNSLWKVQALLELNEAVLHSFALQNISIVDHVDHHTASDEFINDTEIEESQGGIMRRIVPPIPSSNTQAFRHEFGNICLKPNFFPQINPWKK